MQAKAQQHGGLRLDPAQLKGLKPETVSIYQVPQAEKPKPSPQPHADYYRQIQMNTAVPKEVIDSLGGIINTVKPIEQSLREHEMRPFDIEPNYFEELMLSRNP